MHDAPLNDTLVSGIVLAFVFASIAYKLRLPPLAGYLMAGVVVGPFTPGYVADGHLAHELAEVGVVLLMYGVGLHFSLKDLAGAWAGRWHKASCSAWRCRWQAPWCCCGRWKSAA